MSGPYVIGIDGGTESLRAGVFDTRGHPLAFASSTYETRFPQPSWAEQDPAHWWRAAGAAVREAVAAAKIDPSAVAGLACDTTCCSVVALDARGHALRPALIWMDVRAGEHARAIAQTGDSALKVNGGGRGPVSAEWLMPKARWLAHNDAETFAAARYICEYQDYLNYHLTGRMGASLNNASVRWHYDNRSGGYQHSLLERSGLENLAAKLPADVVPMGEVFGELTPAAAAHLGLEPGLPVTQGGADAFVAMIGLGVTEPGRFALITGSSHLQLGLSDRELHGAGIWGTYPDAVIAGLHTVEGGQTSTGSIVNWFKNMLDDSVEYAALNAEAAAIAPGSEGIVVLDHFQGNRTPFTDPDSRGVISGLTLKHGRAHLFRAMMEGVAFGTELIFDNMRTHGLHPAQVTICGGATRSDLWMQIHADVSNLPLTVTEVADAPALGSAVLSAVGCGLFDDIPAAASAMVHTVRRIEPDAERHGTYKPFFDAYKQTYIALKDTLHAQAAAGASSG